MDSMRLAPPKRWSRGRWLLAAALSCGAACASSGPAFSYALPPDLPSIEGWEKNEARGEMADPRGVIEYQLFVRPGREAVYEVIRYRMTFTDASEGARAGYNANERLQWDLNGRTLRRFELVPTSQGGRRWEELAAGSQRFARETGVILGLLGLHRKVLGLE
jgi:hypothetical protein